MCYSLMMRYRWDFTVPAKLFADFVTLLPNDHVECTVVNGALSISCKNVKTQIRGIAATEFPLIPAVTAAIREFFACGKGSSKVCEKCMDTTHPTSDVERKIIDIMNEQIRPALARDGGDAVFCGFENGIVKLHLKGACSGCPSATITLKMGIEAYLKEYIPEVKEVVRV